MKKLLPLFILALIISVTSAKAQSGWQENSYYNQRGSVDVSCSNCYSVFVGYNSFGQPVYQWYQDCQKRVWYSWYGGRYGYYWVCNGNGCYWDYRYETRNWWYFTWQNFTKRC